jgi:hypothetical protein
MSDNRAGEVSREIQHLPDAGTGAVPVSRSVAIGSISKNQYEIRPIENSIAQDLVVKNRYLHRKAPCSFAFGLFEKETNDLMGVVMYGTPASAPLRKGICGPDEKDNVIELTRLWVSDEVPANGESFLIGNTIPLVDKEIIVSFAEIEKGHVGYVYQSTNWIYTGLSMARGNWTVKGLNKHSHTIADKYTSKELREKYGDDFITVPRPRKHRYVYFNASRKRKKELLRKLRYPVTPYPKGPQNV